ncbi:LacI family transcriptional regulator [Devosia nitrariae]|uniref:LacI family transcriptional regulator n=1 Tax=Devosia nitrariae TaxID=2071872 RepID=A0ABQ5W7H9_9HYPH|nr:LacI family transcriptional regulator [Devosia nitrariae]GLQ55932.1 LacI family transcriptional regulator [Devosia nitrariae]
MPGMGEIDKLQDDLDRPARRPRRGASPSDKPTLKTIAQMTGLAVTTISRALNNAPELAQETRERVQRIAAEIGYLPDRAALRLKTGRTNVISLVLEPDEHIYGFGTSLVTGITEALRGTAYHLVITPQFRNIAGIEPIRHIVRNRMADGVIFSKVEPFDERVKFLFDAGFPFVSHGRSQFAQAHAFVDFDNEAYASGAVERLAKRGCRKVAILLPESALTYSEHLRDGFVRAAEALQLDHEIAADVTLSSPTDAIRTHVIKRQRRPDPPDGYVCCSEISALAVIDGLAESGRIIGGTAHVVTKQATPLFAQFRPGAETVFEDFVGAGRRMGELLLLAIGGAPAETLHAIGAPHFAWPD